MELRDAIDMISEFLAEGKYGWVRVNCQAGEITNTNVYETHKGTALKPRKPSIGAHGERKESDAQNQN